MSITADDNTLARERRRIEDVYAARDRHVPRVSLASAEAVYAVSVKQRLHGRAIAQTLGTDLADKRVLDVGCGTGAFLRQLCEWGATPAHLTGTEYLADRLDRARAISHPDIHWWLGDLQDLEDGDFDLVVASLVFSSVLDDVLRHRLARAMWEKTAENGFLLLFDFRFGNPANKQVKRVAPREVRAWWPGTVRFFRTGFLVPILMRRVVGDSLMLAELLAALPFLRSHFVLCVQKDSARG